MDLFFRECAEKLSGKTVVHGACIFWTGCVNKQGYGQYRFTDPRDGGTKYKTRTAHRVALMVKERTLDLPPEQQASHLCNNKLCVNTEHLVLESCSVNCQRRLCFRLGRCIGHINRDGSPAPNCLVDLSQ